MAVPFFFTTGGLAGSKFTADFEITSHNAPCGSPAQQTFVTESAIAEAMGVESPLVDFVLTSEHRIRSWSEASGRAGTMN